MRLFVAVDVPDDIKEKLYRDAMFLKRSGVRASYPALSSYHITLKFLGEVAEERLEGIIGALSGAFDHISPFEASVEGRGVFPGFRNPRVVWGGVRDEGGFSALKEAVDRALEVLGFGRDDKAFVPHITLGRVKRAGMEEKRIIRQFCEEGASYGSFTVSEVVLYRSILRPEGAEYRKLHIFKIGGVA